MAGHYLKKRLRTASLARRLASFALILLVVAVLMFRLHGIEFEVLRILLAVVGALAALALVLALFGLARVWRKGYRGGGAALAALVIGALVAAPFAFAGALALRNPPTNMAETDGIAEEEQDASAATVPPAAPTNATQAPDEEEALNGRVFAVRASQVYAAVRLVLGDVGWTVGEVQTADPEQGTSGEDASPADEPPPAAIAGTVPVPTPREVPGEAETPAKAPDPLDQPDSGEYRIAAVAASPVLGLPSDVEIRIVEDDSQAYLDLRSVSRFGSYDFGQNRRFIEDFLARVDTAMVGTVAPAGS
ncbi:DUF1499 domain-containing protein [Aureimonas leprariae]|uniref:DUF1499 domain-containing protein n=1 Tax=Plantimonas leprariae TaxID=2615207 RepID=A0A7V7PNT7_9HYPH|nr:DUF1499 domain-containing protein [Aureimonas leprariae]KAB0679556.1 DUF1499 domain-containing protein [Aureimonas leprariae]